jgi:hypothetical protein
MMQGHVGVLPEDVQAVLTAVVGHRLVPRDRGALRNPNEIGEKVLRSVTVP